MHFGLQKDPAVCDVIGIHLNDADVLPVDGSVE